MNCGDAAAAVSCFDESVATPRRRRRSSEASHSVAARRYDADVCAGTFYAPFDCPDGVNCVAENDGVHAVPCLYELKGCKVPGKRCTPDEVQPKPEPVCTECGACSQGGHNYGDNFGGDRDRLCGNQAGRRGYDVDGSAATPRLRRRVSVDGSARLRGCDVDSPSTGRGDAAVATWIIPGAHRRPSRQMRQGVQR